MNILYKIDNNHFISNDSIKYCYDNRRFYHFDTFINISYCDDLSFMPLITYELSFNKIIDFISYNNIIEEVIEEVSKTIIVKSSLDIGYLYNFIKLCENALQISGNNFNIKLTDFVINKVIIPYKSNLIFQ
jgi:hypothetical protein